MSRATMTNQPSASTKNRKPWNCGTISITRAGRGSSLTFTSAGTTTPSEMSKLTVTAGGADFTITCWISVVCWVVTLTLTSVWMLTLVDPPPACDVEAFTSVEVDALALLSLVEAPAPSWADALAPLSPAPAPASVDALAAASPPPACSEVWALADALASCARAAVRALLVMLVLVVIVVLLDRPATLGDHSTRG